MIGTCKHGAPYGEQCDECDYQADLVALKEAEKRSVPDFMKGYKTMAEKILAEFGEEMAMTHMVEVIVADASGMEDRFDEGSGYMAELHDEDGWIWVYDRFGVKTEIFEDRVRRAS